MKIKRMVLNEVVVERMVLNEVVVERMVLNEVAISDLEVFGHGRY